MVNLRHSKKSHLAHNQIPNNLKLMLINLIIHVPLTLSIFAVKVVNQIWNFIGFAEMQTLKRWSIKLRDNYLFLQLVGKVFSTRQIFYWVKSKYFEHNLHFILFLQFFLRCGWSYEKKANRSLYKLSFRSFL